MAALGVAAVEIVNSINLKIIEIVWTYLTDYLKIVLIFWYLKKLEMFKYSLNTVDCFWLLEYYFNSW